MKYTQITVKTTSQASEIVAYYLQEVCLDGVSIYDKSDLYSSSWDYVDDNFVNNYDQEVTVSGCCEKENTDSVLCFLRNAFFNLEGQDAGSLAISTQEVDGDEWLNSWKQTFTQLEIGNVIICPEWLTVENPHNKKVLLLETGIAFGTGQHETTSMVLDFMQKVDMAGKSVVDVGCGSGILGLVALLLGAGKAVLIDNDSQATEVSLHNAQLNGLEGKCHISCSGLVDGVTQTFDVLLANLTADILYILAQDISKVVHKGSKIILSGILTDRAHKVIDCYQQKGFTLVDRQDKGEWTALVMEY